MEALMVLWSGDPAEGWSALEAEVEGLELELENVEVTGGCDLEPGQETVLFEVEGDLDVATAVAWVRDVLRANPVSGGVAVVYTPGKHVLGVAHEVVAALEGTTVAPEGTFVLQFPALTTPTVVPAWLVAPGSWRDLAWETKQVDGAALTAWESSAPGSPWLFVLGEPAGAPVTAQDLARAVGMHIDGAWNGPDGAEGFSGDSYGTADHGRLFGAGWTRGGVAVLVAAETSEAAEDLARSIGCRDATDIAEAPQ